MVREECVSGDRAGSRMDDIELNGRAFFLLKGRRSERRSATGRMPLADTRKAG
jgi:hypothetical protein